MEIENIYTLKHNNNHYYNVHSNKKYTAFGTINGSISIYKNEEIFEDKNFTIINQKLSHNSRDAILSLTYRPYNKNKTENVILNSYSNQTLCSYLPSNNKLLYEMKLKTNYLDIKYDDFGYNFIAAGQDGNIYLHDDNKKSIFQTFKPIEKKHSNRCTGIFLKNNLIVSIGWDRKSVLWDIRDKKAITSIFTDIPDKNAVSFIDENKIMFGTLQNENNLKIFDLRNYETPSNLYSLKGKIRTINYIERLNYYSILTNSTSNLYLFKFDNSIINYLIDLPLDFDPICSTYIEKENSIVCGYKDNISIIKLNIK